MKEIYERSATLLGEAAFEKIHCKTVTVFGLGGVGGTCFEALLRSGVGHLVAVDADTVEASNLNRQILFLREDIGREKAVVAAKRAADINPEIEVTPLVWRVGENNLENPFFIRSDVLVDCIDDLPAKIALARFALKRHIPLFVSLGMANRFDPSAVKALPLDQTSGDPLAKKYRSLAREAGLPLEQIMCVLSSEPPKSNGAVLSSLMMVPSAAGLLLAHLTLVALAK